MMQSIDEDEYASTKQQQLQSRQHRQEPPLSWGHARQRLRGVLEDYIENPPSSPEPVAATAGTVTNAGATGVGAAGATGAAGGSGVLDDTNNTAANDNSRTRILKSVAHTLEVLFRYDMDVYAGSLLASLAFLVMSCLFLSSSRNDIDNNDALFLRRFYKSQVGAAVIMMAGCLLSALLMRRRRNASAKDSGAARRLAILRYLQKSALLTTVSEMKNNAGSVSAENEKKKELSDTGNAKKQHERTAYTVIPPPPHLAGTSLSDIYPVYRTTTPTLNGSTADSAAASSLPNGKWVNVPALLLVEGDYVALQIGDIAPAKCCSAMGSMTGHSQNNTNGRVGADTNTTTTPATVRIVTLAMGQRIKTLAATAGPAAKTGPPPKLPLGRTTIPSHSSTLLSLNNVMQIFIVQEAPMSTFLQRQRTSTPSPQVHRQLHDIRQVMYVVSIFLLILSYFFIAIRPNSPPKDWSVLFHAPLLAAMGGLPIISPIFLLLLEVVGTARILVAVHPFATTGSSSSNKNSNSSRVPGSSTHLRHVDEAAAHVLLRRYMWATLVSRVSLPLQTAIVQHTLFHHGGNSGGDNKSVNSAEAREEDNNSNNENDSQRSATATPAISTATRLIPIPAASMCLLEKLGVATAFSLVDDELACETNSTPQQLLIPSANGLKLLDLCPTYDENDVDYVYDDDDDDSDRFSSSAIPRDRERIASSAATSRNNSAYIAPSSASESDDSDIDPNSRNGNNAGSNHGSGNGTATIRKLTRLRKRVRKRISSRNSEVGNSNHDTTRSAVEDFTLSNNNKDDEVQFEDPLWWQHLPSLKCIGLACLLVDHGGPSKRPVLKKSASTTSINSNNTQSTKRKTTTIEEKLVQHICVDENRKQFQMLGSCIGFKTDPNSFGPNGDTTPFDEVARFQVVSSRIFRNRLTTDTHALGLEDSRNWGKLRTDSTSVIVQDNRSKAYQLLTVGDPRVVTALCQEAWQGENSTILPLSATDRQSILATSNDWTLADLDVAAFSYTPLPHTLEKYFDNEHRTGTKRYLLDNPSKDASRDVVSEEWSMIGNQIFLGVLGSSIIPRREIEKLLAIFGEAGVRFVYFSPRNMRRTKEVASQMGIDVAWNCAISLRPLDAGEDDQYRMVSNYADWDVNAKLPHGIDDVRKHLEEVDNVPLLVSLFTDVTKENTAQMVETFQEYSDTVLAMGLSHLARNADIFDKADLSVGVDVLFDETNQNAALGVDDRLEENVYPLEVDLVTSISTSSCVFRLKGPSSTAYMPEIIASSRAALEAAGSAVSFVTSACAAFSMYIVFAMCSVSTALPIIPALGSVLYLLLMIPIVGLAMAMSEADPESMKQVPPKNDKNLIFGKNIRLRVYLSGLLKGLLPAIVPQLLWLIAFGELMITLEPDFVKERCGGAETWVTLIRCEELKSYTGGARTSAGALTLAQLALCTLVGSASFLHRTKTVWEETPWRKNKAWLPAMCINIAILTLFLVVALDRGSVGALPWYFFVIAGISPFICLIVDEWLKIRNKKHVKRAVMMRRLQFETRLGMWSPK